jgi:hypothetical protein
MGISIGLVSTFGAAPDDPLRVLPIDSRLRKPRNLDGYFPLTPPATREQWEARRKELREQVLVATGLWPMPERPPIQAVVHGKIDRGSYTIQKVFFASYPGHYVTGNLYRPKGMHGRVAGVLSPHGHWRNGRLTDELAVHGEKYIQQQIAQGAEQTPEGARYPLQARGAQLARMDCVVFHYDMVGYADSKQIEHRAGFNDAEAELRLQSFMGLQTFNSIRALDFLLGLEEVNPKHIGVTGASGGGTQTFMLCAVDERPTAAFPAVMVSTAMQGGCICENCSYLRQDTGNIELAALFAPKPLGMTGANDWTKEIETKGLPELQQVYRLYGVQDHVMAKAFLQFGHNYNQVSREVMYNWFNKHLLLKQAEPVKEQPFTPVPPQELSVFDEQHPLPKDTVGAPELRRYLSETSDKQLAAMYPKNTASLSDFRHIVGTALRVMVNDKLPRPEDVEGDCVEQQKLSKIQVQKLLLGRKGKGEQIPAVLVSPEQPNGTIVVWVHPAGKASLMRGGQWVPAVRRILEQKASVLAVDALLTGESQGWPAPAVDGRYAGYTFGYNRPLLANRVHDILTAVAYARGRSQGKAVNLTGFGKAGPWVVLARALCGDAIARTAVDVNQFRFQQVKTTQDEMMLPGAIKYGGLPAFTALCAPGEIYLYNHQGTGVVEFARDAYQAAGMSDRLQHAEQAVPVQVVQWLLR